MLTFSSLFVGVCVPMTTVARPDRLLVLLAALVAFAPLSIDTYLPSLPEIANSLAASQTQVQMTIGVFLLGLCVGMLFYGPLSDRFGRRPILLAGLALYLLASVGCMAASSVEQLIAWRFFQALGGAAASVLARAIVRDLYPLNQAARALSLMHLVTMIATLAAPLAGSALLSLSGWRSIFGALLLFSVLCLLASLRWIPETHPASRRGRSVGAAFAAYWHIGTQRRALGCMLCMGFSFGGMFAFITASPFVYVEYFGVSPSDYAWLFGMNIAGIIVMTFVNARLVTRLGTLPMLGVGAVLAALSGVALAVVGFTGVAGLAAMATCILVYVSVTGLLGANSVARLLALYPQQAGAAAGLAVSGQFACGAGFSALVSYFANGTPLPMCLAMAAAGVASLGAFLLIYLGRGEACSGLAGQFQPGSAPGGRQGSSG